MIDFTKPVQTRRGYPVMILTTDGRGNYPVVGYIRESTDVHTWMSSGRYCTGPEGPLDLINVPEKRVVYVNLYPYPHLSPGFHPTRKDADKYAMSQRHARVRVEYTEGQFDE